MQKLKTRFENALKPGPPEWKVGKRTRLESIGDSNFADNFFRAPAHIGRRKTAYLGPRRRRFRVVKKMRQIIRIDNNSNILWTRSFGRFGE